MLTTEEWDARVALVGRIIAGVRDQEALAAEPPLLTGHDVMAVGCRRDRRSEDCSGSWPKPVPTARLQAASRLSTCSDRKYSHRGPGIARGRAVREQHRKRGTMNDRIKWKVANAGFVGEPGWVYLGDRAEDPFTCLMDFEADHPKGCMETWDTVRALPGETREEAEAAHAAGSYLGAAYHLSDCELRDERPAPEES